LFGPTETAAPQVAFWPDKKGFTPRTLKSLIAAQNPVIDSPERFAEVSIAAKGLLALEQLLYAPAFNGYAPGSYTCHLVQAVAGDLARTAAGLERDWRADFAPTLASAGAADNAVFFDQDEALRALYTQLLHALEFTADARIGRPMGSFDKPRPARAEAHLSRRSLPNVLAASASAVALADALADWPLPRTHAALEALRAAAAKLDDPSFADAGDLSVRFKLEVLQQKVKALEAALEEEVGLALGIAPGFNASDGD
ncbi:MAG TPA: signal peptidase, partial [Rhodobacterales bacterium]|nr:signal peptidase [Rhodobacterales bacterium]